MINQNLTKKRGGGRPCIVTDVILFICILPDSNIKQEKPSLFQIEHYIKLDQIELQITNHGGFHIP